VRAGVYHGQEPLCSVKDTQQAPFAFPKWHEWLEFDLNLTDLPRGARLCLSICSATKRKKKEEHYMLAWGNVNMFDYRNCLLTGKVSLSLWPVPKGFDALLNHLGTTGSNPNKDAPCLEVEFDRLANNHIVYPDPAQMEEYGKFITSLSPNQSVQAADLAKRETSVLESLHEIKAKDPLSELSEQDKDLLWQLRHLCCRKVPDALPKLLDAVKWNNRDEVAQVTTVGIL
jgi:phosphatidylinositol-4,5-bisphosphate 3-kinase